MESCISINTRQGKVIVKIAEDATQDEILVDLKKKLKELKKLYKDDDTPILISGKVLKNTKPYKINNRYKNRLRQSKNIRATRNKKDVQ